MTRNHSNLTSGSEGTRQEFCQNKASIDGDPFDLRLSVDADGAHAPAFYTNVLQGQALDAEVMGISCVALGNKVRRANDAAVVCFLIARKVMDDIHILKT